MTDIMGCAERLKRARGCAVGAAVGDALGMPLEFGPRQPEGRWVRDMRAGSLPAGTFTDDTEMALALAESVLAAAPLDGADLARRFVAWLRSGPSDVGIHTHAVLSRIAGGSGWQAAVAEVQAHNPDSAGNGSVMRCWPVALARWDDPAALIAESELQSRVTHPHPECCAGSVCVNLCIRALLEGLPPAEAVQRALLERELSVELRAAIMEAPSKSPHELPNSGWVRHTVESAVWGLVTTTNFEDAVVAVVNLGNDADTAGAVVGALAGAAYGLDAIPQRWQGMLRGEYPLGSGRIWGAVDLVDLADALVMRGEGDGGAA